MKVYLRKAEPRDLAAIMEIIGEARVALAQRGIPQWLGESGPNEGQMKQDLEDQTCYVLILEQEIAGVGVVSHEIEEAYEYLLSGAWQPGATSYASIHRFAVSQSHQGKGLALLLLRFLVTAAALVGDVDIRIDTHPANQIMQKVIQRAGFSYVGELALDIPHGERYGYQLWLE